MARSLRDIRRKMKAIKSTRQVTKALELVSASKMRRATQNAIRLRTYALAAWHILQRMADVNAGKHPFLTEKSPSKILAVLITSDRGQCGSMNSHLFRRTAQYAAAMKSLPTFKSIDFIAVGRKGQQYLHRTGQNVVAAFPALSNYPSFRDTLPIQRLAMESFMNGSYDHVVLLYTDFISVLAQAPVAKVLLPLSKGTLREMIESISPAQGKMTNKDQETLEAENKAAQLQYVLEPSVTEVLDVILPQLTEVQLYQAVLESSASEHAARMVAMRSASDNASEILGDLSLTYNQTRQAGITAELAELSASKAALE